MKLLFKIILLIMFTSATYGQQDTIPCNLCDNTSRSVTNMGLIAWHGVYNALIDTNLIGGTQNSYPWFQFSAKNLDSLRYGSTSGPAIRDSTSGTIIFRFFLDNNNQPAIALANCADTSKYLKGDGNFYDQAALQSSFANWRTLNDTLNGLILVDSYNTCWSKIGKGLNNGTNNLYVTILAHTVSPLDTAMYQLPTNGYEGYVAFDIVLAYFPCNSCAPPAPNPLIYGAPSIYLDFAAPCPKNCYGN